MIAQVPADGRQMMQRGDAPGFQIALVADASIYPRLVGANTNASVVAIAEKASDMILGKPAPAPIGRRD